MLLKRFYINIWIRVVGIVANSLLLAACILWMRDVLIVANVTLLLTIQVFLLVRSLNKLNKDLESFFEAVHSQDSSLVFSHRKSHSAFSNLYQQLDNINKTIQQIKIENQNQNQYFKALVEHIGIGIIGFTDDGKVTLFNSAASELLKKANLFRITDLDTVKPGLSSLLRQLKPSEPRLVSLYQRSELMQLSVKATWIRILDQKITLVSLQNIRNELDEKELESWQKLIRVLTHELMNSVGPMSSTIATLGEFLVNQEGSTKKAEELTDDMVADIATGLHILEDRSHGMVDFVTRFRNLTLLPQPVFTTFGVGELFGSIQRLLAEKLQQSNVKLEVKVANGTVRLTADRGMVEQILLNLVGNAIYALEGVAEGRILLIAQLDDNNRLSITVADNGVGIPPELHDKVFIPFFSTRKDGSGIGLSLSRQLMRLHGGTITLSSTPGEGTVVTLRFGEGEIED